MQTNEYFITRLTETEQTERVLIFVEFSDKYTLEQLAMYFGRQAVTFRTNLLPPYSG